MRCYGHVIHQDINSQICAVVELEIVGEKKNRSPRKLWEEYGKIDLAQFGLK